MERHSFLGIDIGKSAHYALAVDLDGTTVYQQPGVPANRGQRRGRAAVAAAQPARPDPEVRRRAEGLKRADGLKAVESLKFEERFPTSIGMKSRRAARARAAPEAGADRRCKRLDPTDPSRPDGHEGARSVLCNGPLLPTSS
jgi:hypothetical protein